jgi:RNA polymerase primary sigma factor/RNA polymerase sigma factor
MADEMTREIARRMHYAAWRWWTAEDDPDAGFWIERYYLLRDLIVMGNRKLVFRAVRRWNSTRQTGDDLIGECCIVLIRAVRVYNPWLGVRFSTYAFTCLLRALARQAQRWSGEWFARCVPLEALGESGSPPADVEEPSSEPDSWLSEYFRDDHPLLSHREKAILMRRFRLDRSNEAQTLEQVGQLLGLSKERVRQVQAIALGKLRQALKECPASDLVSVR